jgi:hypothetical protein
MHSKEIHQEWYQETFEVISVEPHRREGGKMRRRLILLLLVLAVVGLAQDSKFFTAGDANRFFGS